MTKQTWIDEFYTPVKNTRRWGAIRCVEHSLQKWRGALKENLRKHRIKKPAVPFDISTCALCVKYQKRTAPFVDRCKACPLYASLGGRRCDGIDSEFSSWVHHDDPAPMIAALEAVLVYVKAALDYFERDEKP